MAHIRSVAAPISSRCELGRASVLQSRSSCAHLVRIPQHSVHSSFAWGSVRRLAIGGQPTSIGSGCRSVVNKGVVRVEAGLFDKALESVGLTASDGSPSELEVSLQRPLGIVFAEDSKSGEVFVEELVEGGSADSSDKVHVGWTLQQCEVQGSRAGAVDISGSPFGGAGGGYEKAIKALTADPERTTVRLKLKRPDAKVYAARAFAAGLTRNASQAAVLMDSPADDIKVADGLSGMETLARELVNSRYTPNMVLQLLGQSDAGFVMVKKLLGADNVSKYNASLPQLSVDKNAGKQEKVLEAKASELIRLFLLGLSLKTTMIEDLMGQPAADALRGLGILVRAGETGYERSTLMLTPVPLRSKAERDAGGARFLYIFTDWPFITHTGAEVENFEPVMYIGDDSMGLVNAMSYNPAVWGSEANILDLCTGSGVQALAALALFGTRATCVDLNPRAQRLTRLNAYINGLGDVTTTCVGDLYNAIAKRGNGFDVITANPPFIPAPRGDLPGGRSLVLFSDGGVDGEEILKRIVKQAPEFLSPAGKLLITSVLPNPDDYDKKMDSWWNNGAPVQGFVYYSGDVTATAYAKALAKSGGDENRADDLEKHMVGQGISTMAPGLIFCFCSDQRNESTFSVSTAGQGKSVWGLGDTGLGTTDPIAKEALTWPVASD